VFKRLEHEDERAAYEAAQQNAEPSETPDAY